MTGKSNMILEISIFFFYSYCLCFSVINFSKLNAIYLLKTSPLLKNKKRI